VMAYLWKRMGTTGSGRRSRNVLLFLVLATIAYGMICGSYFGLGPPAGSPLAGLQLLDAQSQSLMMPLTIVIGVIMNAAITYSGLKIGFTLGGSAIAAVLGWGVLRGILRKGSIVENNIAQTIASSVNTSNSGVIFTVPVLFLLGVEFDWVWLGAACVAGSILGVAFIVRVLVAAPASALAAQLEWADDLDSALELARDEDRIVLVDFFTTWCKYCKKLDEEVLQDERFAEAASDVVAVRLDADKHPDWTGEAVRGRNGE